MGFLTGFLDFGLFLFFFKGTYRQIYKIKMSHKKSCKINGGGGTNKKEDFRKCYTRIYTTRESGEMSRVEDWE